MPGVKHNPSQNSSRPRAYNNLPTERYQGRASFANPPPSKSVRQQIQADTITSFTYMQQYWNLPADPQSIFYDRQLPPLDPQQSPGLSYDQVKVDFGDTFVLTRAMRKNRKDWHRKIAVLNCASDAELAGGWKHRAGTTQEDALCYSSDLFPTLEKWRTRYPWRSHCVSRSDGNVAECAGIFSPWVCIFKDELANGCKQLERDDTVFVSVLSVAAIACPPTVMTKEGTMMLKSPKDKLTLIERARMVLRMAAHNGKTVLMLGAMGCGVWACPPREVAQLMKAVLQEQEFAGWFEEVRFGIYDEGVCEAFKDVFEDKRAVEQ